MISRYALPAWMIQEFFSIVEDEKKFSTFMFELSLKLDNLESQKITPLEFIEYFWIIAENAGFKRLNKDSKEIIRLKIILKCILGFDPLFV